MDNISNHLLYLHYDPDISPEQLFREHQQYGAQFPPVKAPHWPSAAKIRIGYVSGDFKSHACACFLLPLLEAHDRSQFDVFCYATKTHGADHITERFKALSTWRSIDGVSDHDAHSMIAADRIDVLVDCSGHSSGKRLSLFAMRPAPVAATFLGYPDTTGLSQIDYRLTDAVADPVEEGNVFATEHLIRFRNGVHTYRPLIATGLDASSPPVLKNGFITFCSFNKRAKVNDKVLSVWADILRAVPGSRLLVKGGGWQGRPYMGDLQDRVDITAMTESYVDHLALYNAADIALDTFPYSGTTTTCDALWMGVPVVTWRGRHHAARASASLLTRIGLTDLIAESAEDYVAKAMSLAQDTSRLVELRARQRARFLSSPLGNAVLVVRDLENFYVHAVVRAAAEAS